MISLLVMSKIITKPCQWKLGSTVWVNNGYLEGMGELFIGEQYLQLYQSPCEDANIRRYQIRRFGFESMTNVLIVERRFEGVATAFFKLMGIKCGKRDGLMGVSYSELIHTIVIRRQRTDNRI